MPESSNDSEATPPSAPTSARSPRVPTGRLALVAALVAAACSWNALAAPFAVLTGLGAVVLAVNALRRGGRRATPVAALLLAVLGAAAGVLVLGAAAGVGVGPEGELGVEPRSPADLRRALDEAASSSRAARARAAAELERLPPRAPPGGAPAR